MGRWITAVDEEVFSLPHVGACYAIFIGGTLTYVGSAERLRSRIGQHCKLARYSNFFVTRWGRFPGVIVKYRPSRRYGDWAMVELRLIRRLQPPGNTRGIVSKKKCRKVAG